MTLIELPRAVEAYFSFAELPATDRGRNFTITFTYMDDQRVDRLQWWWQVHRGQERSGGEAVLAQLRSEAIMRFRQHIERWLYNSRRCLRGGDPFPLLMALPQELESPGMSGSAEESAEVAADAARGYPRRVAAS
ncbi:MAG TPA: hypothetical protein VEQ17_10655 [Steroidobacteraceae bacterium]|nr:hypothetical protein [Steroidobacteraceae bacterium]